ncbi:glycoside hydrolase family 11 protein [uncultured Fibrobacter sp.]|uniref:glycoside hydrolase family 11 protein n=1 Tax=uncultured Fibrobacter sp. TaxID=261512 RepID=UPI0025D9399C|nr:glycoside hydrolase family 11 protein [uncultured Fibrobacter sp.]
MEKSISKMVKFGVVLAFGLSINNAFAVDACNEDMGHPGNGSNVSGNQVGGISGTPWGFEQWYQGGNATMTYYSNGTFKANWSGSNDYLTRVGYQYNGNGISHTTKHFTVDYKYTKTGSASYGYIGVYGWTKNPETEYYIVDDWYSKPSEQYVGEKFGEITVDGAKYTIHAFLRQQEPSKSGTSTFVQFFSIRETPRQCGHIDISAHFKKWDELFTGQNQQLRGSKGGGSASLKFGNVTEVMLMTEAGGGATGSVDYTYFNMSDNGEASPVTSSTSATTPANGNTGDAGAGQGAGQGMGGFDFGGGQGGFNFGGGDGGQGGFNFGGGDGGQGGFNFGGGDGGQGGFNFGNFDWSSFGQGGGDGGMGGFNFGGGQGAGQGGNTDFSNFDWGGTGANTGTNTGDQTTTPTTTPTITPIDNNGGIIAALPSEMKMSNGSKIYRVFNATGRYLGTLEANSGTSLSDALFAKFGKVGIYMVKSGSKTMSVKVAH